MWKSLARKPPSILMSECRTTSVKLLGVAAEVPTKYWFSPGTLPLFTKVCDTLTSVLRSNALHPATYIALSLESRLYPVNWCRPPGPEKVSSE